MQVSNLRARNLLQCIQHWMTTGQRFIDGCLKVMVTPLLYTKVSWDLSIDCSEMRVLGAGHLPKQQP